MNAIDFILLGVIAAALVLAFWLSRRPSSSGCACCGNCSACMKRCGKAPRRKSE